ISRGSIRVHDPLTPFIIHFACVLRSSKLLAASPPYPQRTAASRPLGFHWYHHWYQKSSRQCFSVRGDAHTSSYERMEKRSAFPSVLRYSAPPCTSVRNSMFQRRG